MTEGSMEEAAAPPPGDRRRFIAVSTSALMTGGLVAGYGMFAHVAGRFLYPAHPPEQRWLFVADLGRLPVGTSIAYRTPAGAPVTIARNGAKGTEADFIALGSTCPHLGCQVHFEAEKKRFFCPCHNGSFDTSGRATGGPPAEAGQSLPRFPLKVENGLLYIEVPVATVGDAGDGVSGGCPRPSSRPEEV